MISRTRPPHGARSKYSILSPLHGQIRWWLFTAPLLVILADLNAHSQSLSHHDAIYDVHGTLLPWAPWNEILEKEMTWYLNCPVENGYPRFVFMTFMTGDYTKRADRDDFIPSTQNGMGIISYLKYHAYTGKKNPKVLEFARAMGDWYAHALLYKETQEQSYLNQAVQNALCPMSNMRVFNASRSPWPFPRRLPDRRGARRGDLQSGLHSPAF